MEKIEYAVILKPARENFIRTITTEESRAVEGHFEYFKRLFEKGTLKYAGRCEDGYLGLAILECENEPEARALMAEDPAIASGVFEHTIKAWRTALVVERWS